MLEMHLYIVAGAEFEELQEHVFVCSRLPMVQHLEEHVGMTRLLAFFNKWISCNLHSSGKETQVSSMSNRGVREFWPKIWVLSLTLTDQ